MTTNQILQFVNQYQLDNGHVANIDQIIASAGLMPAWMKKCVRAEIAHLERCGLVFIYKENVAISAEGLMLLGKW